MLREHGIEQLLNAARDAAIQAYEGQPATKVNLRGMAEVARTTVLAQAEAGFWREWCVTSSADISAVKCTVEIRPTLGIRPPINIVWNWMDTPLRHLATSSASPLKD